MHDFQACYVLTPENGYDHSDHVHDKFVEVVPQKMDVVLFVLSVL